MNEGAVFVRIAESGRPEHETDDRHEPGEPDAADELEGRGRWIIGAGRDRRQQHDDSAECAERPDAAAREQQSALHADQGGNVAEHRRHHLRLTR